MLCCLFHQQEIIDAVKQVCTILPSSIKGECDSLIDMYGPTIVNMLVHDVKPKELCTTLTLCSKVRDVSYCSASRFTLRYVVVSFSGMLQFGYLLRCDQ